MARETEVHRRGQDGQDRVPHATGHDDQPDPLPAVFTSPDMPHIPAIPPASKQYFRLKLQRPKLAWLFLGLRPSADLTAVAIGYFVQGCKTQMAILAERYFLKDVLLFQPSQVELWLQIAHVPWVIKPLLGFVSDTFPIRGERRRPYLILCGLTAASGFFILGMVANTGWTALLGMALSEAAIAFLDVVVDGIIVERARHEPAEKAGSLQSICWGYQAVGLLTSAALAGWLIAHLGPQLVLAGMAVLPLAVVLAATQVDESAIHQLHYQKLSPTEAAHVNQHMSQSEEEAENAAESVHGDSAPFVHDVYKPNSSFEVSQGVSDSVQDTSPPATGEGCTAIARQILELARALMLPAILIPALFIFLNTGQNGSESIMFFFYTNHLGLSPEFVGSKQFLDGTAQLLGVLLYSYALRNIAMRKILLWVPIIAAVAMSTQVILVTGANRALGIPDKAFVLTDSFLLQGTLRAGYMPIYVLAARVCPKGIEASLYAALMSVGNTGASVSALLAAGLMLLLGISSTNFTFLWLLLLLLALPNLSSLFCLPYLPAVALEQEPPKVQDSSESSGDSV